MDPRSLKLFDHVFAVYRPPEKERDPKYAEGVGKRGLFQLIGVVGVEERRHVGDLVFLPRQIRIGDPDCFPHRVPLSHLEGLELAPPEAGKVILGAGKADSGKGG
jgi:hypothetical protein